MDANNAQISAIFHDVEYIAYVSNKNDTLSVYVEERYTGEAWKCAIQAKAIEDMTTKTGHPTTINAFAATLTSALNKENPNAYADFLTQSEMDLIKNKKQDDSKKQDPSKPSNIRYLFLSIVTENQRVHYPMPLLYDDNPDQENLKRTLDRIKAELESSRKSVQSSSTKSAKANSFYSNDNSALEEENEMLKKKAALYELTRPGAIDLDNISKSIQNKAKDISKIKKDTEREINDLKAILTERERELEDSKSELSKTKSDWGGSQSMDGCENLRNTLTDISKEIEEEKKAHQLIIEQQLKDLEVYRKEMLTSKEGERKASSKIKQLETDLDAAIKKLNSSLYGKSYRPNRNSSQKSSGYGKATPPKTNSKRTTSLPSQQKKPQPPKNKAPVNKQLTSSGNRRSPYQINRSSPYNSRSGSKGKSNPPLGVYGTNQVGKRSQPTKSNQNQRSNRPINLTNQRISPAPKGKESVFDRLASKPVQLSNMKSVVKKEAVAKQINGDLTNIAKITEKVEQVVTESSKGIEEESMYLTR